MAGYLEKFAFIADADDDKNHDRQLVAAMVNYLEDIVANVAQALKDAGMWEKTLMVWSSDNGAAVELTTGMKNSYPLRGGYYTNWDGGVRANALINGGFLPAVSTVILPVAQLPRCAF
jgi:arylsulfatase A-like enzyme